jgi:outer membrane receptor protein involved in Fe transport
VSKQLEPVIYAKANPTFALTGKSAGAAVFGILCGLPHLSEAQESSEAPAPAMEEVLVSAQKRGDERLQDVPVPVSVVNTEKLAQNGQLRLRDYYSRVPGLSMSPTYLGQQSLTIRGVTAGGSDPTVAIVVDDVPFGMSIDGAGGNVVPDIDPSDLERIEVLRGPQGALFGANSMGGVVKFVTKDPSTEGYSGRAEAGLSSVRNGAEPGFNVRGAANIPLSDALAIRASGYTREDAGYIDNPVTGEEGVNDARSKGGQLTALWRPTETVSLRLGAMYQQYKADGVSEVEVEPGLKDLQQSYLPGTGEIDRTYQAYSATLKVDLGNHIDLAAVSGYNVNRLSTTFDRSYQWGGFAQRAYGSDVKGAPYHIKRPMEKFTQELRLSGPLGTRFEWLLGGFYNHEDGPLIADGEAVNATTQEVAGPILVFTQKRTFQQRAAFAGLTYQATDQLDVQFGGRVSRDHLDVPEYSYTGPFTTLALNQPSPLVFEHTEFKGSTFTYLVTPRFKVSPDLMVYARLATGYRPGAPNFTLPGVPAQSEPDKTQNYEIGVKGNLFDGALTVDTSLYYIDWQDIQLSVRDPVNGTSYFSNGSAAKSEGLELSITSRPLTGLTVSGWFAYNNAVLTKDLPSGPLFGLSGDRLPSSPRYSGNFSVQQNFPLWDRAQGFVGAELTYVGDRVSLFQGTARRQDLPSYTQTDLRVGVEYEPWTANVYVNNLTDKRGLLNGGLGYLPPNAFVYTQPRTIGLGVYRTF